MQDLLSDTNSNGSLVNWTSIFSLCKRCFDDASGCWFHECIYYPLHTRLYYGARRISRTCVLGSVATKVTVSVIAGTLHFDSPPDPRRAKRVDNPRKSATFHLRWLLRSLDSNKRSVKSIEAAGKDKGEESSDDWTGKWLDDDLVEKPMPSIIEGELQTGYVDFHLQNFEEIITVGMARLVSSKFQLDFHFISFTDRWFLPDIDCQYVIVQPTLCVLALWRTFGVHIVSDILRTYSQSVDGYLGAGGACGTNHWALHRKRPEEHRNNR